MGVAGLLFGHHPPNFDNQTNFWRCPIDTKMIFSFLYRFQISNISVECSVHICSCRWISHKLNGTASKIQRRTKMRTLVYLAHVWFASSIHLYYLFMNGWHQSSLITTTQQKTERTKDFFYFLLRLQVKRTWSLNNP